MTKGTQRFHVYRYQLLPKDRFFQGDLYGASTIEEVISRKNELFAEALRSKAFMRNERTAVAAELLLEDDDFYLFRMAANRSLQHETLDFRTEVIDNWPRILVAVWNDPTKQLIAVQHRSAAFQETAAVVRIMIDSISPILAKSQLRVSWDKLVESKEFWDLVRRHKNKIGELSFDLITPNMANISGTLPEDLKEFAKRTNAVETELTIKADPGAALVIDRQDPTINGLVDYSSAGCGEVSIRLIGMRKKIHTSGIREFTIEEASISGPAGAVADTLRSILTDVDK